VHLAGAVLKKRVRIVQPISQAWVDQALVHTSSCAGGAQSPERNAPSPSSVARSLTAPGASGPAAQGLRTAPKRPASAAGLPLEAAYSAVLGEGEHAAPAATSDVAHAAGAGVTQGWRGEGGAASGLAPPSSVPGFPPHGPAAGGLRGGVEGPGGAGLQVPLWPSDTPSAAAHRGRGGCELGGSNGSPPQPAEAEEGAPQQGAARVAGAAAAAAPEQARFKREVAAVAPSLGARVGRAAVAPTAGGRSLLGPGAAAPGPLRAPVPPAVEQTRAELSLMYSWCVAVCSR
jgi:hypothetical protein